MKQIASFSMSAVALTVAIWAANETRQTRLDTKRLQLRSEALEILQEAHLALNKFHCYATVKGVDIKDKENFMRFFADNERLIRESLSDIAEFSLADLATYEKTLNSVKGQVPNAFNESFILIRNSWSKELRETADSVCNL